MKIYKITPVSKPRMTKRDKWLKPPRLAVQKYWNFKTECKLKSVALPDGTFHVHFVLPMPKTWSKKKKALMLRKEHRQKPDIDNLEKALFDSLLKEDSHLSDVRATKWWGNEGLIIITPIAPSECPF